MSLVTEPTVSFHCKLSDYIRLLISLTETNSETTHFNPHKQGISEVTIFQQRKKVWSGNGKGEWAEDEGYLSKKLSSAACRADPCPRERRAFLSVPSICLTEVTLLSRDWVTSPGQATAVFITEWFSLPEWKKRIVSPLQKRQERPQDILPGKQLFCWLLWPESHLNLCPTTLYLTHSPNSQSSRSWEVPQTIWLWGYFPLRAFLNKLKKKSVMRWCIICPAASLSSLSLTPPTSILDMEEKTYSM